MDDPQPPTLPSLRQYRDAIGDDYLAHRPSFARCEARLRRREPVLAETFDRAAYDALMEDIRRLEALLKEAKVDTEKFEVERYTVNSWSPGNFQVKAHLRVKADPAAGIEPPPTMPFVSRVLPARPVARSVSALFVPDIHFGWLCETVVDPATSTPALKWQPIHDPHAVAVVLAVAEREQPPLIVVLGDMLDLPGLGRWDTSPTQRQQTLSAIQSGRQFLSDLRGACPKSRIVLLEGNHEKRWRDYLMRNAPELLWASSVPEMLGVSEWDIEYVQPYSTKFEVSTVPDTFAVHGELIGRTGGESAAKMLKAYPTRNTIFGHTHRLELAFHTDWSPSNEPLLRWSMGCGTLARLDGAVPGSTFPDWQQGFGIVAQGRPAVIPIHDGSCSVQGRIYQARHEA